MGGALEGIRVVDFTQHFAGPGTAMYLADQGAEVLKIEPPNGGRDRQGGPFSDTFLALNRGKHSIALDIRPPAGHEIAEKLVRQADVMLVAWPPGQADRLGYGYELMRELNPRLVYGSITGWGTKGPLKDKLGYDRLLQAHTGLMAANDMKPTPVFLADMAIPMLLAYGVSLALLARERTGMGQKVETTQLDAQIAMQAIYLLYRGDLSVLEAGRGYAPSGSHTYRASDGRFVTLAFLGRSEEDRLWPVVDIEPMEGGISNAASRAALAARFASETAAVWEERLTSAGIHHAVVLTREEFVQQPQAWANGMLLSQEHPAAGKLTMMNVPVRLSATAGAAGAPAPSFGAHTRQVLAELGYPKTAIDELYDRGVVA